MEIRCFLFENKISILSFIRLKNQVSCFPNYISFLEMQINTVQEVLNTDMKAVRGDKLSGNHKITFLILSDTTTQTLPEFYTAVTLTVSTTVDILSDKCSIRAKLQR